MYIYTVYVFIWAMVFLAKTLPTIAHTPKLPLSGGVNRPKAPNTSINPRGHCHNRPHPDVMVPGAVAMPTPAHTGRLAISVVAYISMNGCCSAAWLEGRWLKATPQGPGRWPMNTEGPQPIFIFWRDAQNTLSCQIK